MVERNFEKEKRVKENSINENVKPGKNNSGSIGKGVSSQTVDEIENSKEKENLRKLEAVFFVSGRFLSMQELISLSDLNPILLRELIEKLQKKYDNSDSALEILKKNNMWKMDVRDEFKHLINKLATGQSEFSKAEKETLALIAYKQPIKQSVIVKIRGNKSYDHIKKFVELGFIEKKKEGHTYILQLSDDFYDYFALEPSEGEGEEDSLKNDSEDREERNIEKGKNTLKKVEEYTYNDENEDFSENIDEEKKNEKTMEKNKNIELNKEFNKGEY